MLNELGRVQDKLHKDECIGTLQESVLVCQRIGDTSTEAIAAYNLGHAHFERRDLVNAERWYKHILAICDQSDGLAKAKAYGALAQVAKLRLMQAHELKRPEDEQIFLLKTAVRFNDEALGVLPVGVTEGLAGIHMELGIVYELAADYYPAMQKFRPVSQKHFAEAIRVFDAEGNVFEAARSRLMMAYSLFDAKRLADAQLYALAALRGFEPFGPLATDRIEQVHDLIAAINAVRTSEVS